MLADRRRRFKAVQKVSVCVACYSLRLAEQRSKFPAETLSRVKTVDQHVEPCQQQDG